MYQDILLNAWKSYPSFRSKSKISTWLYHVAINTAITKLKKKTKSTGANEITGSVLAIPDEDKRDSKSEVALLYKSLQQLSDMDKTVALLYLDQLSYREITTITGIPETSIGVRISRVKEKLKKILLQYGIR